MQWDVFCKVVDNFGDIGVCWRLARNLAHDHAQAVRLWVDDLERFQYLCPQLAVNELEQTIEDVRICRWPVSFPSDFEPGSVVVETFACELPKTVIAAMNRVDTPPLWINLEYLSAESWVEDCHWLPSPHPTLPLTKHFCFPGFTPRTAGLLREQGLFRSRDEFIESCAIRQAFCERLGLHSIASDALLISLFSYEQPHLPALLERWSQQSSQPVVVLVPEGRVLPDIARYFSTSVPATGACLSRGALTVHVLPFMSQNDYDRLLWLSDLNFVRGEDSFVRAQWAAKPFVWQLYRQEDNAHLIKLEAFLKLFLAGMDDETAQAVRRFWDAWNEPRAVDLAWDDFAAVLANLRAHVGSWTRLQAAHGDLSSSLVKFVRNSVK